MDLKDNFNLGDLIYGMAGIRIGVLKHLSRTESQYIKTYPHLSDQYNALIGIGGKKTALTFHNLFLQIYNFFGREKNKFKLANFENFLDFDKNMDDPLIKTYLSRRPDEMYSYKEYATDWAKAIGKYPQKFNESALNLSADIYHLIISFLCRQNISRFIKKNRKIHFILEGINLKPYTTNVPLTFSHIDLNENMLKNQYYIDKIKKLIGDISIQIPSTTLDELIECYRLYNLDYTYRKNIKFYKVKRYKHHVVGCVESLPPWISNKDQWHTLLLELHNSEIRNRNILIEATIVCFNNYIKKQIGSKEEDAYVRKFVTDMVAIYITSGSLLSAHKCIYQLICDYDKYTPKKCFFAEMLFEYLWRYKENFLYLFRGVANFSIRKPGSPICQNMYNIFTNIRYLKKRDFRFSIKEKPKDDFYMGLRSKRYLENNLIDNNYSNLGYYSDSNGFI
ncbi:hypothetical protein [Allofrancisella frigidaquae]|uniref:Uncharacterized protein n=1 Tax=Allofrancisella frigidaquae TaxID=1085644 RepID=A0A6M3HVD9_9GAMM|nr:hypothetical protein [Allofrancisella frigidaquae]QIV95167.1 hypothetical protein E3E15_07340 [Allofrancisella frigidaquae]